jgi:hypothetical protein
MNFRDVPIPPRMKRLPRDRRGYPIPAGVYRDDKGEPHFAINDELLRQRIVARDLCSICGQELNKVRWFVGGPLSAFSANGLYIDPPMHHECADYSLRVCPYLAAPNYGKRVDLRTLERTAPEELNRVFVDPSMLPERPDLFVAISSAGQENVRHGTPVVIYIKPVRPSRRVEYWRNGVLLPSHEGERCVANTLSKPIPEKQAPRLLNCRES